MIQLPPNAPLRADFAEEYATFSANLTVDSLPPEVIRVAKDDLFDTLACAISGAHAPGVGELRQLIEGWGGTGEAGIWCSDRRVPAHHAAWINGMMAHATDFDDIHTAAQLHLGVSLVPALLAAAELDPGVTGADLLAGMVAGMELMCRMGLATTVSVTESGYLYTSLYGHFGATAAVARALRFTAEETVNALGIALSQAAGTHQVTRDAAMTKRMQPGFAAKTALISAQIARAGILGARHTFEGEDGLFPSYLHGNYRPEKLRDGLGQRFDLLDLSFKAYPCCGMTHAAIDAALALARQVPLDRISKITVFANRTVNHVVGTPIQIRQAPETPVQAQFSIPFTFACALVKGSVRLSDFTTEGIRAPEIRKIAAKVFVEVDPAIDQAYPRIECPVRVLVETGDGPVEIRIDKPKGSSVAPMTIADFDAKMADCLEASGVAWPAGTDARFRQTIDRLETLPRGAALAEMMRIGGRSVDPTG